MIDRLEINQRTFDKSMEGGVGETGFLFFLWQVFQDTGNVCRHQLMPRKLLNSPMLFC